MKMLSPLSHGPIARLWAGQALSALGDQFQRLALIWLSTAMLGPRAGYVASAETGAVLVAALVAGAWTERWDARRTMIWADFLRGGLAALPLLAAVAGRLDLWALVGPAMAIAALRGVFDPALQASLPRLSPASGELVRLNALMDATARMARLFGPMLAAALIAVVPATGLMALNGVSFLVSAVAIASLARDLPRSPLASARGTLTLLGLGVDAVRRRPLFIYLLLRGGIVNGLWVVAMWLCLPLAVQAAHLRAFGLGGAAVVGLVMGAYGAGNLAGNLAMGEIEICRPVAFVILGNAVVGVGLMLMALAMSAPAGLFAPLTAAAAALAALGGPCSDVPMATLRQTSFALDEIAAVYRLSLAADHGGMLLASALAPALLPRVGPTALIMLCGAGILAAAIAGLGLRPKLVAHPDAARGEALP